MTSDFTARSGQYRDALYEALEGAATNISDASPLSQLSGLVERCSPLADEAGNAGGALAALEAVARQSGLEQALSEAAARFASPQRFREALYFARCLERDPDGARSLLAARGYLEGAAVPAAQFPELARDQAALLDATAFGVLWAEPTRYSWALDGIGAWKQAYIPVYAEQHGAYNAEVGEIAREMDAMQPRAAAVERLNSIQQLGPPQAQAALSRFHELEAIFACPADAAAVAHALTGEPLCPYCGFRLGSDPPADDARRVVQEVERGLASHQTRLAQLAVARLQARRNRAGSDRLDRFIEVVQAGDQEGLAAVLDDGLIAFLRDLLEGPEPSRGLIDQLADRFPEISAANLDDAVSGFRLLLQEEVERNGGRLRIRQDRDS